MKMNNRAEAVYKEAAKRLAWLVAADDSTVKARLAELRHGAGNAPGEIPTLWGMIFDELPEEMLGRYGKPSSAEWAIYDAMTIYAVHQQGNDPETNNMNVKGISLGKAACDLVFAKDGTEDDRERVSRRFYPIVLAADIETFTYYLRTFIPLLRGAGIGLDYAMLARDIYLCQSESGRSSVQIRWGQDYYSSNHEEGKNE